MMFLRCHRERVVENMDKASSFSSSFSNSLRSWRSFMVDLTLPDLNSVVEVTY